MVSFTIENDISTSISIPENCEKFDISNCPNLTSLPPLPETLRSLSIHNCPMLTSLPNFPQSIIELYIYNTPITILPCESFHVKYIGLSETKIQVLPTFLEWPHIELDENPFNLFYGYFTKGGFCPCRIHDYDPNQIEDFLEDYTPISKVVRKMLHEGIPFDTILKDFHTLNYYNFSYNHKKIIHKLFEEGYSFTAIKQSEKDLQGLLEQSRKEKAIASCKAFKEDLMIKTWHPKRVIEWCWDEEEKLDWNQFE